VHLITLKGIGVRAMTVLLRVTTQIINPFNPVNHDIVLVNNMNELMDRVAETNVNSGVIWTKHIHPIYIANGLTDRNSNI